jgi:hypothetical protein
MPSNADNRSIARDAVDITASRHSKQGIGTINLFVLEKKLLKVRLAKEKRFIDHFMRYAH